MEEIKDIILSKKKIVIFSGAGVSVHAGIPDYRSGSGIFAQLREDYPNIDPSDLFSRRFHNEHPEFAEHPKILEFRQAMKNAEPQPSHYLPGFLDQLGILKRVYTQNIDGLYLKAGLDPDKLVEYHGNMDDTVMYGDPIPPRAIETQVQDFILEKDVDGCICMGTSLQVAPFNALVNAVPRGCTRILVDINPTNAMSNRWCKPKMRHNDGCYDYISTGMANDSWVKIGKQKITLRPLWDDHKRFDNRIVKLDCDEFAKVILNSY